MVDHSTLSRATVWPILAAKIVAASCSVISCRPTHSSHLHLGLQVDYRVVQKSQHAGPTSFCKKDWFCHFDEAIHCSDLLNLEHLGRAFSCDEQVPWAAVLQQSMDAIKLGVVWFSAQDPKQEFSGWSLWKFDSHLLLFLQVA